MELLVPSLVRFFIYIFGNLIYKVSVRSTETFGQPQSGIKYNIIYNGNNNENCFLDKTLNNAIFCNPSNGIEFYLVDVPSTISLPPPDQFQLSSVSADNRYFYTKVFPFSYALFGQISGFPTTNLFTFKVDFSLDENVTSLNFKITSLDYCENLDTVTLRVYLLLSLDNVFENISIDLQSMLYTYSKLYLSNNEFENFNLSKKYMNMDLRNLYNRVSKKYFGLVKYIGIIVMPENKLQSDNIYCRAERNLISLNITYGKDTSLYSLDSATTATFNTNIDLNMLLSAMFGQSNSYPKTKLFTYNSSMLSTVNVSSLNFSINNCNSINFTMRVYLLVSQYDSFNNIFIDLKSIFFIISKMNLLKEQFVTFVLNPGYNSIDLLSLFTGVRNKYSGLVKYIGVIVMPESMFEYDNNCNVNQFEIAISYGKDISFEGAVSFQSAADKSYLCHNDNMDIEIVNFDPTKYAGARSFLIYQNDSLISIKSAHPAYLLDFIVKFDDHFKIMEVGKASTFTLVATNLVIKKIEQINSSSVNVTVNSDVLLWSLPITIKCENSNNVIIYYPVRNYTAVISSLQNNTMYKFSACVKNEFGLHVYGKAFSYQINEMVPLDYPVNFTVVTVNFTTLFLLWESVEFSVRNGIILKYVYSCNNTQTSISNFTTDSNWLSAIVSNLNPYTYYDCSVAACNSGGCGVKARVFGNTLVGNVTKIDIIQRYSANVTIKVYELLLNVSKFYVIKVQVYSQDIQFINVTGIITRVSLLHSYATYNFWVGVQDGFDSYVFGHVHQYTTDRSELVIKHFEDITSHSVNITISPFIPNWNISANFKIRYFDHNNVVKKCNVTNGSAVISSLKSYTVYEFSVGVRNEFGYDVYGDYVNHQTKEDVPSGHPHSFTVTKINFTAVLLSWGYVEYSMRNGIVITYEYSCNNTEYNISNTVDNSTFRATLSYLNPETIYDCSVAACTKVGCGVKAYQFNLTLVGTPSGFPLNFSVTKVNLTTLSLSWGEVEYSMRNGIIVNYVFSCNSTKNVIINTVDSKTFNTIVSNLNSDTTYNCGIAACTKVGCGVFNYLLVESWSEWSSWTACNDSSGYIKRTRECNLSSGTYCPGTDFEREQCSEKWAIWSECSVSCGVGIKTRYSLQKKPLTKVESCHPMICPVDGMWGSWVLSGCSTTCGNGVKERTRVCSKPLFDGLDCLSVGNHTEICENNIICPVNGIISMWSLWSLCNQPCGGGKQSRFRSCSNPMFGGHGCNENLNEFDTCNQQSCKSVQLNLKVNFIDNENEDILALRDVIKNAILNVYSHKVSFKVVVHSIEKSP